MKMSGSNRWSCQTEESFVLRSIRAHFSFSFFLSLPRPRFSSSLCENSWHVPRANGVPRFFFARREKKHKNRTFDAILCSGMVQICSFSKRERDEYFPKGTARLHVLNLFFHLKETLPSTRLQKHERRSQNGNVG